MLDGLWTSPSFLVTGQGSEVQGRARCPGHTVVGGSDWITGVSGPRPVLTLMAPGLHPRRDGIPTAEQALGASQVHGEQPVVLDFTAFTAGTFSDLNLGRRSSKERPQRGSAAAGCHVCGLHTFEGTTRWWLRVGQAILPSHTCTCTHAHAHQEKRAPALPRGHPHIIYTHGGVGDVTTGFWGAIRPSKLPFLLIKQARRALPFTDKTSQSRKPGVRRGQSSGSASGKERNRGLGDHTGRPANLQKQTKR